MESKDFLYKNEKYVFNNGVYFCEKLNFDVNNKPSIKTLKLLDEEIIKINNKFYIVGYRKSYGSKKKNKKTVINDSDINQKMKNQKMKNQKLKKINRLKKLKIKNQIKNQIKNKQIKNIYNSYFLH